MLVAMTSFRKSARRRMSLRRAFTLIEMIVVIAIIAILLGLVLPGAAAMWRQRNEAGTLNLVRGLLESARSQARRAGERGLLFFVDPIDNVQRVAFIEAEPPNTPDLVGNVYDRIECEQLTGSTECITPPMAVHRFRVTSDKVYTVPPPYRVAPAQVMHWAEEVNRAPASGTSRTFLRRLGTDLFYQVDNASEAMVAPRNRNFFTVIFDRQGVLQVGRNVLVHDRNAARAVDSMGRMRGDKTRLFVTDLEPRQQRYLTADAQPAWVDPDHRIGLFNMVCYSDGTVANFPSVDGLVVYDNSVSEGLDGNAVGAGEEAGGMLVNELLANARPLIISRQTGDVIVGEKGI